MVVFNGKMRLKVIEADNIRATEHSTRYFPQNPSLSFVSPYVSIDIDDLPLGRTHTKEKTGTPAYNEEFSSEVHSGHQLHFTIFHDAALPPDEYVADCTLKFETIHDKKSDIWINLEPTGRIHVSIELQGQFSDCKYAFVGQGVDAHCLSSLANSGQQRTAFQAEQARLCSTSFCGRASRLRNQRAQIHGNVLSAAHLLLNLFGIHLVSARFVPSRTSSSERIESTTPPHSSRGIFRTQGYQCQGKPSDVASQAFCCLIPFCLSSRLIVCA